MDESVADFLAAVPNEQRRTDAERLCALLIEVTGEMPALWGHGIVGFGRYAYRYPSGHSGEAPLVGFAPRKPHLVLYLCAGFEGETGELLAALGPHKNGKGCLYLSRLDAVDLGALRGLVVHSIGVIQAAYPAS